MPVHTCGLAVIYLHAVHPDVALTGDRIAGNDYREGDKRAAVLRPAVEDGEIEEIDLVVL
jgi:hypothetical protein